MSNFLDFLPEEDPEDDEPSVISINSTSWDSLSSTRCSDSPPETVQTEVDMLVLHMEQMEREEAARVQQLVAMETEDQEQEYALFLHSLGQWDRDEEEIRTSTLFRVWVLIVNLTQNR